MRTPPELEMDREKALRKGIDWTGNYFRELYKKERQLKQGVIGISGGCDSALTAYITTGAIGNTNVIGVLMPEQNITPKEDVYDAEELIKELGIDRRYIDITNIVKGFLGIDPELSKPENRIAYANIKPRVRMTLLYMIANKVNGVVVGTDDRSENILGYFTKYGDGGVDLNVPEYLYKTQVRKLLEHISEKERIPVMKRIADKKPSPRLWEGQTAEEEMNLNYEIVDRVLYYLKDNSKRLSRSEIVKKLKIDEKIIDAILERERSAYHKREMPPYPEVSYEFFLFKE